MNNNDPVFAIGDIQGCDAALATLLKHLPENAQIICLGDIVNRGPNSLAVLRRLKALGNKVRVVLGNHDLHLLACAHHLRQQSASDTLSAILNAPDRDALIDWLRHQPLALLHDSFLCVHAGVIPQWTTAQTLSYAQEVEYHLQKDDYPHFLSQIFGNQPVCWDAHLNGAARMRCIVNVLTRLRFCNADGCLDFTSKDGRLPPPTGYLPWFEQPKRKTAETTIVFGHWSTMGLVQKSSVIGLDTGCVWGGKLSAVRLNKNSEQQQFIQIDNQSCFLHNQDDESQA